MSRISTNISGIERTLLNRLAESSAAVTTSTLRLVTGKKINSPADDPASFVFLSGLQSQLSNVTAAMVNVTAASSMITQAQTAIDSIQTELSTIRTELIADEARSLTGTERTDAQTNIDAAIEQINALAATQIGGRKLLDGSADYQVQGRRSSQVSELRVYSTGGSSLTIDGSVDVAATKAELTYTGNTPANTVIATATFTLTGESGSTEITVTADESLDNLVDAVNDTSHDTGITASIVDNVVTFSSVEYGSDAAVDVDVSSGTFAVSDGGSVTGTDASVTIDGQSYTADGNRVAVTENSVHYEMEFTDGFSGDFNTISVGAEALTFALSTETFRESSLAIPSLQAGFLGGVSGSLDDLASGGTIDGLDANTSQAIRVVDEAIAEVTRIEGVVDGFYNSAVSSTSSLLSDIQDDLETAIDDVDLVDSTEEAARLTFYSNLASNAVAGLTILNQQRASIVVLLKAMAGLT